jgi:putative transposase
VPFSGTPEVHHSDQEVQYTAHGYTDRPRDLGIRISMAAAGQVVQDPCAEGVTRTIKEEEVDLTDYESFADAYLEFAISSKTSTTPSAFTQPWAT